MPSMKLATSSSRRVTIGLNRGESLLRQMASGEMPRRQLTELGHFDVAEPLRGDGTARMERAPRRRRHRARHVAFEEDALAPPVRIRNGHGTEQRLRVGMLRRLV